MCRYLMNNIIVIVGKLLSLVYFPIPASTPHVFLITYISATHRKNSLYKSMAKCAADFATSIVVSQEHYLCPAMAESVFESPNTFL